MSTTNRNKVLFGFGALVAVLIVAIVMWPTNVQREDATGAIGAVQKHRAPQITPQDVVLGNEEVKHQQKVLYADFLADAAKLRAIGSAQDVNLAALSDLSADIGSRFEKELSAALANAEAYASRLPAADRARAIRDIGEIRGRLPGRGRQLRALDMAQYDNELRALGVIAAQTPMESIEKAANVLANTRKQLEAAPLENQYASISKKLQEGEEAIGSAAAASTVRLNDEVDYLTGMTAELKVIEDFELLAKQSASMEKASRGLLEAANDLDARAVRNIGTQVEMESALFSTLKAIGNDVDVMNHMVANRMNAAGNDATEQLSHALSSVAQALRSYDAKFAAQTQYAVQDQLAAARGLDNKKVLASLGILDSELSAKHAR